MKKTIIIEGMSCNHCVAHVKEALESLSNVTSVNVDLQEKCATVETSESDDILKESIEDAGYDVIEIK